MLVSCYYDLILTKAERKSVEKLKEDDFTVNLRNLELMKDKTRQIKQRQISLALPKRTPSLVRLKNIGMGHGGN